GVNTLKVLKVKAQELGVAVLDEAGMLALLKGQTPASPAA
ncbi:MAG: hypothetical protein RR718_10295, partial [Comamonas sp.]